MLLELLGAVTWPSTAFVAVHLLACSLTQSCLVLETGIIESSRLKKISKFIKVMEFVSCTIVLSADYQEFILQLV